MGRVIIYTYSCDSCKSNFKTPDEVLHIDGNIINGDDQIFYTKSNNSDEYLCKKCFIEKILNVKTSKINTACSPIVEEKIQDENPEYITLQRINNEDDEDIFIQFLGHVSRTNFESLYKKSVIGCFYPIETETSFDICNCSEQTIDVIYKAFAGIPQIKKWDCLVDHSDNFAYIEKNCLLKEEQDLGR